MRASYDAETSRLRLDFESAEEARQLAAAIERDLGFMVSLPDRLGLHHPVTVVLATGSLSAEVGAKVAQVFDRGDSRTTAFLVEEAGAAARQLAEAESAAAQGESEAAAQGEMRGSSPIHRIKQMNPRQRSLLALKAGRTERQILLRDNTPQVLQNLLNNPHIDSEEVLQIARSSHAVAPILQRIASDARWSANQEIMTAVVRHPRTPSMVATRHLPALRTQDLRTMGKLSSGVKEVLRKAALKEYMRRTGQRI